MKWVTVLEVGCEGGTLTLLGQDGGDDVWKYILTTDETTLRGILSEEDAEGVNFTSTSPVAEDWESIIELLGEKYPYWMNMHPLECHPLFRNRVRKLLMDIGITKTRGARRWMKIIKEKTKQPLLNIEAESKIIELGAKMKPFKLTTQIPRDIEKAGQLFQKAGFDLPTIPDKLAVRLKQRSDLDFSTRVLPKSVNYFDFYVDEANKCQVDDYVILSRAIWSPSVDTIHYFLVLGPLRMFLQLCWGGFRIDADVLAEQIQEIRHCFSLADQIVSLAMAVCKSSDRLTIVTQSFGSNNYWVVPGQDAQEIERRCHRPKDVLGEALQWLKNKNNLWI